MHDLSSFDKRKLKIRKKIRKNDHLRLTVYKSNKHIYTQVYTFDCSSVLVSCSSVGKSFKNKINELNSIHKHVSKIKIAELVGNSLVKKLKNNNITKVVFDRSGFKFHGRIKMIADVIRKHGIEC